MNIRDLVKDINSDKGAVIITEKKADVNTVIRSVNRYDNEKIVGLRVETILDVAYELICAHAAYVNDNVKIARAERDLCTAVMYKTISEEKNRPSFIRESSVSIETASEIFRVMNMIRLNDPTDEYESAKLGRIAAFKTLIKMYEKELSGEGFYDDAMIMEKALHVLDDMLQKKTDADVHFLLPWTKFKVCIAGFSTSDDGSLKLCAKKLHFIEKIFKVLGLSLEDNTVDITSDRKDVSYHFFKGYGSVNEVRYVVETIAGKDADYADNAIIYAGGEYENIIRAELENANIPYTFSSGYHGTSEPHVAFILALLKFASEDYSYEVLNDAVSNSVFKLKGKTQSYSKILKEGIGWGKERYIAFFERFVLDAANWQENDHEEWENKGFENKKAFVDFLKRVIDVFDNNKPDKLLDSLIGLVDDCTYKDGEFKKCVRPELKTLVNTLKLADLADEPVSFLADYLRKLIIPASSDPGKVMLLSYTGCKAFDRKNVFCVGFSRENIERTITESLVLSDEDIHKCAKGYIEDARGLNKRKRENFLERLECSAAKDVYVGYSYYDTVSFLKNSPSRFLYLELMKRSGKTEKDIISKEYDAETGAFKLSLDDFISSWDGLSDENEENPVNTDDENGDVSEATDDVAKDSNDTSAEKPRDKYSYKDNLSASHLQSLLGCALKYHYEKHLNLHVNEYIERTGNTWLDHTERGNLLHYTMEDYCKRALIDSDIVKATDEELLRACLDSSAQKVLKRLPAPSDDIFESEKNELYDYIKSYVDELHAKLNAKDGLKVIGCEIWFEDISYSFKDDGGNDYSIKLHGYIDRADGYVQDDTLYVRITDYKTSRYDSFKDKIDRYLQIQHYVYSAGIIAYALSGKKTEIEKRFAPYSKVIVESVDYDLPLERESSKRSIPMIEIMDNVDKKIKEGDLIFPDPVKDKIALVECAYQSGDDDAISKIGGLSKEQIKASKKGIDEFCKYYNYCRFMDICRVRLGLMTEEDK